MIELIFCARRLLNVTKSHQSNHICQHCGVKTSTVTPSFYYAFNISLSCNYSIRSFIGNLWRVLLLGNHLKFSKIVFAVWNFVRSLKFYYKNNFCLSLNAFKINWIELFYFKLNSRKWENLLCVFQRNSPKGSNDQRGKLDWNWLKFYGKRNTGLHAIIAPNYKQPNKLSQLQNTQLNLLTVTFLAILKWTEINLRWLIVDGCAKEGKRLMITVNC